MRNDFADIVPNGAVDEFTDYEIWRVLKDIGYTLFEFERTGESPPQRLVVLQAALIETLAGRGGAGSAARPTEDSSKLPSARSA